jgi:hypothetical protein
VPSFPLFLAESILVEWYALQANIDSAIDLFDRRVLGVAQNRCAGLIFLVSRARARVTLKKLTIGSLAIGRVQSKIFNLR